MIDVLASVGVTAGRDPRNTGAWVDGRKIGSVGIACRRWVTWHGLALNVAVALDWFRSIEPCGFDPSVMTSLQEHVRSTFIDDPHALARPLAAALAHTLELPWTGEVQHEVPAQVFARLTDRGT
jgi:lipoyl(octanoyl) transferase